MEEDIYLHKLNLRNVKPTAIRLLILRTMMEMNRAVSQPDLEEKLQTVDKSTIFRTISLFLDRHLIHAIDDGSGALKYAVCSDDCTCSVSDQHVHFYCEGCHRAFCFRSQAVPVVQAPEGFVLYGVIMYLRDCARHVRPDRIRTDKMAVFHLVSPVFLWSNRRKIHLLLSRI